MSQKARFLSDPLQSKFAGSHSNPEHLCDIQVGQGTFHLRPCLSPLPPCPLGHFNISFPMLPYLLFSLTQLVGQSLLPATGWQGVELGVGNEKACLVTTWSHLKTTRPFLPSGGSLSCLVFSGLQSRRISEFFPTLSSLQPLFMLHLRKAGVLERKQSILHKCCPYDGDEKL